MAADFIISDLLIIEFQRKFARDIPKLFLWKLLITLAEKRKRIIEKQNCSSDFTDIKSHLSLQFSHQNSGGEMKNLIKKICLVEVLLSSNSPTPRRRINCRFDISESPVDFM